MSEKRESFKDKQNLVNEVFHTVAKQYDFMNDLMSLGMHRLWKDSLITSLNPSSSRHSKILDIAGGTGDIAFRIVEASAYKAKVTIADINKRMLEVGYQRAQEKCMLNNIDFIEANAQELPFEDNSFDACTIAFGIRNVPDIPKALKEVVRVLKTGGRFLCLEFSHVDVPFFEKLYDFWSFKIIPEIGQCIVGDKDPYIYLVESIRAFPSREKFSLILEQSGFRRIRCDIHTAGIVALHSAWKL